jgi:hypothetical protein
MKNFVRVSLLFLCLLLPCTALAGVNVKDFGAVGDGVTVDYAAFVDAFAASSDVFVPSGTYNLGANTLTISRATRITGELSANVPGQVSKIIGTANPVVHTVADGFYVEIEHLRIEASAGNTVWKNECNHLYTKDVDMRGGAIGLNTIQSVAGRYLNSQFTGTQYGWLANPSGPFVFNTNTVIGVTATSMGLGTGLKISGDNAARNNVFINLDCSINNIGLENDGWQNTFIGFYSETIGTAHVIEGADAYSYWVNRAFNGAGNVVLDQTSSSLNADSGHIRLDSLYLKGLAVGEWTVVPYSAGNFSGGGGVLWGVDSGDVANYKYTIAGKVMTVDFYIAGSTISGSPGTQLLLKIPAGKTAKARTTVPVHVYNAVVESLGTAQVLPSGTNIMLYKGGLLGGTNWAAEVNGAAVAGQISFEIQ